MIKVNYTTQTNYKIISTQLGNPNYELSTWHDHPLKAAKHYKTLKWHLLD